MAGTILESSSAVNGALAVVIRDGESRRIAYPVPRLVRREGPHDGVDDEPAAENDDEPDDDVREYLPGLLVGPSVRDVCEVFPAGPRDEDGGEEHGDVNAGVEDVIRQIRYVTDRAIRATARHYLPRQTRAEGKEGERK